MQQRRRGERKTECHTHYDDRRWLSTVSTLIIAPNKIVQQLLLLSRSVGGRQGTATAPIITFVIFEFDSIERRRRCPADLLLCCRWPSHASQLVSSSYSRNKTSSRISKSFHHLTTCNIFSIQLCSSHNVSEALILCMICIWIYLCTCRNPITFAKLHVLSHFIRLHIR